jgi:hypothetical protein
MLLVYIDISHEEIVLYLDPSDKKAIKNVMNLRHVKYNQEGIWLSFGSFLEFSEYFKKIPSTCKYRKFPLKIFNNRIFKEGI